MKILALSHRRPDATDDKFLPYLHEELRRAWELYKNGAIRDFYWRQDRPGVAVFLECESTVEAQNILASLPFVKVGLLDFEVIPLGPFTNWEVLYAPAGK